jgi:hypothetical protein
LKSLQNFVKKFEKGLNGFEFKRFDLKEFEKEKEKKRKDLTSLSARNGPPAHLPSPAMARCDNPPGKIPYYRLRPIHFGR